MNLILLIGAVLVVAGAALYIHSIWVERGGLDGQAAYARDEWAHMPAELRTAKLVASERDTAAWIDGARVPARPDQLYETEDDWLILVETKTRNQREVFMSDIIELSVQRLAIDQSSRRGKTAKYAYVRIVQRGRRGRPIYKRVDLLTEAQVVAHYWRYQGIVSGDITPTSQTRKSACASCGQRNICPSAL